jgi:hypothetical protein
MTANQYAHLFDGRIMSASPFSCPVAQRFDFVPELDDFLELFPHRGSFLWAEHPQPGERPRWNTETRHLLTDRLIKQGAFLYGVRFGSHTHYLMLDLDRKSAYHPYRDPFAIPRILAALESIGLVRYVAVSSSYSGGIHLYFPFVQGQPSWLIAQAVQVLLQNAGFNLTRGQLELFPNARLSWGADYNGHRLPLQSGSYLLDRDWHPMHTTPDRFVALWRSAETANPVCQTLLEQTIKQGERRPYRRLKGLAQKFLNDLNAEIECGWTSYGQTNHLLGKIAQREYIFFHSIHGGEPLRGSQLAERILEVAESLPGYEQWCRHKHEIVRLCLYWARSIEHSNYYPYGGTQPVTDQPPELSWNQQQAEDARERIRLAVAQLLEAGSLPIGTRERMFKIRELARVSSSTLYRNKDLWHVENSLKAAPTEAIQPDRENRADPRSPEAVPEAVIHPPGTNKLSPTSGPAPQERSTDGTTALSEGEREGVFHSSEHEPKPEGIELLRSILKDIQARNRRSKARVRLSVEEVPPDERWFQPVIAGLSSE